MTNINGIAQNFGDILFSILIGDKTLYIFANDYNITEQGFLVLSHFVIKPTIITKWNMITECDPETQEEYAVLYMHV